MIRKSKCNCSNGCNCSGKCSCSNECGCPTKTPEKGKKLDTQLFPKCKGTKYDRDVVKKEERRKKKSFNLRDYKVAHIQACKVMRDRG